MLISKNLADANYFIEFLGVKFLKAVNESFLRTKRKSPDSL